MYPFILHESLNTIIVALSDTTVGKVQLPRMGEWVNAKTGKPVDFLNKGGPTVENEVKALQYANAINDLMPRFYHVEPWQMEDGATHDMIVMERIYPLPIHHFDLPVRIAMMATFEAKMKALHDAWFVHGDFIRPTSYFNRGDQAWMFGNIVQTESGLRLIDAGFAQIGSTKDIEKLRPIIRIMVQEAAEVKYFRKYYLGNNDSAAAGDGLEEGASL